MIAPQLMTYIWRNQLEKEADLLITLQVGIDSWKLEHHEPLIFAFLLTAFKRRDWSGPWGINLSKLGRRDQDRLEELLRSERRRENSLS